MPFEFKGPGRQEKAPETPADLYVELDRENVEYLWAHQKEILSAYAKPEYLTAPDLCIGLPTGTGKTLVGLLIGEFRRRAKGERVMYLCPTRQLCRQVYDQASKYGLKTVRLDGGAKNRDPQHELRYEQGAAVGIATYATLFNSNPGLSGPEVVICDDSHAAQQWVSGMWSASAKREECPLEFDEIVRVLEPHLSTNLKVDMGSTADSMSIDAVSPIVLVELQDRLLPLFKQIADRRTDDFSWAWRNLADHFETCFLYLTPRRLELRPFLSPVMMHAPFADATQRVYMSATPSADGDLERTFGVKKTKILDADVSAAGRRLILFPRYVKDQDYLDSSIALVRAFGKALILVESSIRAGFWREKLQPAGFEVIETVSNDAATDEFRSASAPVVLVAASRYDGIDLPHEECRLLIVDSAMRAAGLPERFLVDGLSAVAELKDRVRTRVEQAMGRCTRGAADYAVVAVVDEKLTADLTRKHYTEGMRVETQAELSFGLENSLGRSSDDFMAAALAFLTEKETRQRVEEMVREYGEGKTRRAGAEERPLRKSAEFEVEYTSRLWKADYRGAAASAKSAIDALSGGRELDSYQALWHHNLALALHLAYRSTGDSKLRKAVAESLRRGMITLNTTAWLGRLYTWYSGEDMSGEVAAADRQVKRSRLLVELLLELGLDGPTFEKTLAMWQSALASNEARKFETGLANLGRMLGADSRSLSKENGRPDALWVFDDYAAIIEAKTEVSPAKAISLETVRQLNSQAALIRASGAITADHETISVLVTRQHKVNEDAALSAEDATHLDPEDLRTLFARAAGALREARSAGLGLSDQELAEFGLAAFDRVGLAPADIRVLLAASKVGRLQRI